MYAAPSSLPASSFLSYYSLSRYIQVFFDFNLFFLIFSHPKTLSRFTFLHSVFTIIISQQLKLFHTPIVITDHTLYKHSNVDCYQMNSSFVMTSHSFSLSLRINATRIYKHIINHNMVWHEDNIGPPLASHDIERCVIDVTLTVCRSNRLAECFAAQNHQSWAWQIGTIFYSVTLIAPLSLCSSEIY